MEFGKVNHPAVQLSGMGGYFFSSMGKILIRPVVCDDHCRTDLSECRVAGTKFFQELRSHFREKDTDYHIKFLAGQNPFFLIDHVLNRVHNNPNETSYTGNNYYDDQKFSYRSYRMKIPITNG